VPRRKCRNSSQYSRILISRGSRLLLWTEVPGGRRHIVLSPPHELLGGYLELKHFDQFLDQHPAIRKDLRAYCCTARLRFVAAATEVYSKERRRDAGKTLLTITHRFKIRVCKRKRTFD
jgi:hypothetical protein